LLESATDEEHLLSPPRDGIHRRGPRGVSQYTGEDSVCLLPYLKLLVIKVFAHSLQTTCTPPKEARLGRLLLEHLGFLPCTSQRVVMIDRDVHRVEQKTVWLMRKTDV